MKKEHIVRDLQMRKSTDRDFRVNINIFKNIAVLWSGKLKFL